MKSTRKARKTDPNKTITNNLTTLHQRLYQSLNLGFRYSKDKGREWYTNDVGLQRLVARSISAFLEDISPETLHNPLVKDSVADIFTAVGSILQSPNDATLVIASQSMVKLISILPSSMLQPHVSHLSISLSSLLSNHQFEVAIMSATALDLILSKLSLRKENEVWNILVKHNVVAQVICNLQNFQDKVKPIDYFVEMASLLSSIMQIWPQTRYPIWNNAKLRELMELYCCKSETSVKVVVLKLYNAIALCGYGTKMLMENGKNLVNSIVYCMGKSQPLSVRILAFKVAQHLMAYEDSCLKGLGFCCKPLVDSVIAAMSCSTIHHGKVPSEEMSLIMEACRLARITLRPGKHHGYLWKFGVHKSLINILMADFLNIHPHDQLWSVEELISVTREGLNTNFLLDLRPYVWAIFGSLSAHCEEDFNPSTDENEFYIRVLIASACLTFVDSIGRERLLRLADRDYTLRSIFAAKAVMMMMYSPCKYIAFHTRLIISELLKLEGDEPLKNLLKELNFVNTEVTSMPDKLQTLVSLLGLTCYSGLPQFYCYVVRNQGVKTLVTFVSWWLCNEENIESVNLSSHLKDTAKVRICCKLDMEDWEGKEIHLFCALMSLAELINTHEVEGCFSIDMFAHQESSRKESFIHDIQDFCVRTSSSGVRWYSSYLLSFFGIYGFPSKLGKRILSLFSEKDYSDMYLVLQDGQRISVHKVILLIQCPSFLPPEDRIIEEIPSSSLQDQVMDKIQETKREVTLSAQVDEQALSKVLEFVYSGCVHVEGDLVRKVKVLAKHCNVQPLLNLLCKKRPKWASSVPNFDLTTALGSAERYFSNVILEANSTEDTGWTSDCCLFSAPHIHSHKAVLMSSCNYFRAIFQSGMQESRSQSLKVPVRWEALNKLVTWVYSSDVPKPVSGCMWDNMDMDKKINELQSYIELCWLAEFWFIDDLQKECSEIVASFLDSPELSLKLVQFAANFSQWEIVDVAAKRIAPVYSNLRCCGALDLLDEGLVEIIRLASVRLSQE